MCGIFGVLPRDASHVPDEARLEATARRLGHRGPDAAGIHRQPGLGFVHTRLALVDLSPAGQQPFWSDDQRHCLVYNGEVYNFRPMREELHAAGVKFRSTSDTEVILHALIQWGPDATLARLEGMFAFAFYDREAGSVLLARDRFGIKPLCLFEDEHALYFASEVAAFAPWSAPAPDPNALASYVLGTPAPMRERSLFAGVRNLPPGATLTWTLGGAEARPGVFFQARDWLDPDESESLEHLGATAIVDRADALLQDAVDQMLFADAAVGALCSGGIDSSLLMAMAARRHGDLAIFHADVVGPGSEYEAARRLADHLKLDLAKVELRDADFLDSAPDVVAHYEQPFSYHPNSGPFLAVSRLVREHGVKGVLSGEGSDECFLGYAWLTQEPVERAWKGWLERAARAVRAIPGLGRRLLPPPEGPVPAALWLLDGRERESEEEANRRVWSEALGRKPGGNARTLDLLGYHLRTLLHRNDRLGMAASIEARFPFLHEPLVRFAVNLPRRYKIRFSPRTLERAHPFFRDKWVVRQVADRYLPRELSQRRKMGFPVSAFERMRYDADALAGSFVAEHFGLDAETLGHVVAEGDPGLRLRLLLLDVWARICLAGEERGRVREHLRRHVRIDPQR